MSQLALPLDGLRFTREGSLTEKALAALAAGPLPTLDVARAVLGISGGGGAAAAAVFTLLGGDPRFAVSAEGAWSLAAPAEAPPRRPLRDEEWVVVDVETTGGAPSRGHRVTEVAAVRVAGGVIRDTWCTLVNPERPIPGMITSLTGITDGMVAAQPRFAQVAGQVAAALRGGVFVAHNAGFDWRFICHEMSMATGTRPAGRQLCTVRLARRLLPELPSRSLDGLALYFGVNIDARHRALDDAVATAKVLIRMLEMLDERQVEDWEALQGVLRKRKGRRSRRRRAMPQAMEAA
ncbi:MAG TPA: exonuclease domain-containing protein [Longimicrobium sp.]|nr:exonuclease domain-containing protein [Longimicrobium sp.]